MKRIVCLLLLLALFVPAGAGCARQEKASVIRSKELTADQKELLSLLQDSEGAYQLFTYETDRPYRTASFWVETYQDGRLLDPCAAELTISVDGDKNTGTVALCIDRSAEGVSWSMIHASDGTKLSSAQSQVSAAFNSGYSSSALEDPVSIENGTEIVLHYTVYANRQGELRTPGGAQEFLNNPELLSRYEYVHLLKCRFTE